MYHVISLIVVLISFSNRISAQTYDDADCNGEICFLVRDSPDIECAPMAVSNSPYVITPPLSGSAPIWSAVAINPIDGQIYVLFSEDGGGAAVYLGSIEDPYNDIAPFTITSIGDGLETEQYTALTFDCEGNAYGVTSGRYPTIIQLDLVNGTEIADVDTLNKARGSHSTCHPFVECRELIMYNFDTDEFIRISTDDDLVDQRLYVRSSIEGPDDPINGTLIDYNGVCTAYDKITSATYIGNGIALVYCVRRGSSDKAAVLDLTDINNPILREDSFAVGTTDALFAYNADGSICKPPSCTLTPTASPTLRRGKGNGNGKGRGKGKGRGRGAGRGRGRDAAEISQNAEDIGYADENEENMSDTDTITVDLSDKTVLHFWALFAVFGVVNIVGCWCIFKRDSTKEIKICNP